MTVVAAAAAAARNGGGDGRWTGPLLDGRQEVALLLLLLLLLVTAITRTRAGVSLTARRGAELVRRTYYGRVDNADRTSTNTLTRFIMPYSIVVGELATVDSVLSERRERRQVGQGAGPPTAPERCVGQRRVMAGLALTLGDSCEPKRTVP